MLVKVLAKVRRVISELTFYVKNLKVLDGFHFLMMHSIYRDGHSWCNTF